MGNDHPCNIVGIGSVKIKMHDGIVITLTEVRHVLDMSKNLISLTTLDLGGYDFIGSAGVLKVVKGALVVMRAQQVGRLYVLQGSTVISSATVSSSMSDTDVTRLWHMRLGHISERGMTILSKRGLLSGQNTSKLDLCKHCLVGKQKRVSFSTGLYKSKGILDYIHSDLWGTASISSKDGARYMLTFIDDYSRKVWVYFLKNKNDVFVNFKQWKALVEKQTGKKIKYLRTDNGVEFCGGDFNKFCKDEGIVRHLTVRGTPQQNSVAERMNRTLLERVRCLLSNSGLSKDFWAEAASKACYLVNRSPNTSIDCKTPEEVWSSHPTDYSELRVFDFPTYVHINDGKLEPRSKKCIFIGYPAGVKGFKIWYPDPDSKSVISRDVVFDELSMLQSNGEQNVTSDIDTRSSHKKVEFEVEHVKSSDRSSQCSPTQLPISEEVEETPIREKYTISRDRIPRPIKKPRWLHDYVAYALAVTQETDGISEPSIKSDLNGEF